MDVRIATLSPAFSAESPATLAQWERAMRQADSASRLGQLVLSLAAGWQALAIAQHLLDEPPAGRIDDCVAALVVSHHHLADLQVQAGATDLAAEQLCRAHEALMGLLQAGEREAAVQQAAWRHSRETHAGLLHFLGEHGAHPAIARGLRAGCMAFGAGDALTH